MQKIALSFTEPQLLAQAQSLASELQLSLAPLQTTSYSYLLVLTPTHLELRNMQSPKSKPLYIDFTKGAIAHRIKFGGGKQQAIAKAVGLHKWKNPRVLDVTAGLGQDAFVLAMLGCPVLMLERHPIIATLLQDALQRAKKTLGNSCLTLEVMRINSFDYLRTLSQEHCPDIIYLDPMFPTTDKSALAKIEMRILRDLAGKDLDAIELLHLAKQKAYKRVVVKRPRLAPPLGGSIPTTTITGKSTRFDIYVIR